MTAPERAALLAALRGRRDDLLEALGRDGLDHGFLRLLADTAAAIAVIGEHPVDAPPAERAVVADDGDEIRLCLYREAEPLSAVVLDPLAAIGLAERLIDAAQHRLSPGIGDGG